MPDAIVKAGYTLECVAMRSGSERERLLASMIASAAMDEGERRRTTWPMVWG